MVRSRVNLNNILNNFLEFSVGKIKARTAPHHKSIQGHSELAIAKVLAPFWKLLWFLKMMKKEILDCPISDRYTGMDHGWSHG